MREATRSWCIVFRILECVVGVLFHEFKTLTRVTRGDKSMSSTTTDYHTAAVGPFRGGGQNRSGKILYFEITFYGHVCSL